ncbi:MAG: lytic transglycosylase domain-containing protein [Alphaproteobacteria bacterium]|nr:lytic transglycosylase domain-containing protein [Alphaproteobacteria bacterium]
MIVKGAVVAGLLALVPSIAFGATTAPEPVPRSKPPIMKVAKSDTALLESAFEAAARYDWSAALAFAGQMDDPLAAKIVRWRYYAADNSIAPYGEISRFIESSPGWPRIEKMRRNAERQLPTTLEPDQVIAWFKGREPSSPDGKVKLGEALLAKGERARGVQLIQEGWIDGTFTAAREKELLSRYREVLTPQINALRIDRLLWDDERAAAQRLMSTIDSDARKLAEARIKLATNVRGAETAISLVPQSLRADSGLLFDRARYSRLKGRDPEAWPLILSAPSSPQALRRPEDWWKERNIQARNAIENRQFSKAYDMVAGHGLTAGVNFAEAEFLAGWIALRFLNDAQKAQGHFQRLKSGVTYPISLARANYWLARALERTGDKPGAMAAYGAAARFPETFYGQLALIALKPKGRFAINDERIDTGASRKSFNAEELAAAIRLLNRIGAEEYVRVFALHFADVAESRETYALLAELMRELGHPELAIRVAKRAMQKQISVLAYAYPVLSVPKYRGRGTPPEPALVLGLSRQESEFDPMAVSGANAQGIMQLLPETARQTARRHGVDYHRNKLIGDATYNMSIGMAHLSDLLASFDGSYILTIAAYNAGAGRVRQWIGEYGDPRNGVDPIDWIEQIPFSETRNYVQRVLENTQIYRARLARAEVPLSLMGDLYRGSSAPPPRIGGPFEPEETALPLSASPSPSVPVPAPAPDRTEGETSGPLEAAEPLIRPIPKPDPNS